MKIGFLFGGQGAQFVGMGQNMAEHDAEIKAIFDQADNIMGTSLRDIMFHSERIHETLYAQPALFTFGAAMLEKLRAAGIESEGSAGLSLGEYIAYYDAGVFTFSQGLETVIHRAFYMDETAKTSQTKMVALLGKKAAALQLAESIEGCEVANFNGPNQTVIGCKADQVDDVIQRATSYGIKRAQPIQTAAAFHTSYMTPAAKGFKTYLQYIQVNDPNKPLYGNSTGRLIEEDLKTTMIKQLTTPVQFHTMIESMVNDGFDTFIEISPKTTLKPLVKKIAPAVTVYTVTDMESLNTSISALKGRHENV